MDYILLNYLHVASISILSSLWVFFKDEVLVVFVSLSSIVSCGVVFFVKRVCQYSFQLKVRSHCSVKNFKTFSKYIFNENFLFLLNISWACLRFTQRRDGLIDKFAFRFSCVIFWTQSPASTPSVWENSIRLFPVLSKGVCWLYTSFPEGTQFSLLSNFTFLTANNYHDINAIQQI